ncbi:PREDICTED: mas-related G-protein coupled receptor member D-like [Elephantulus edwardii]|uniref:mas-related G-protein coupled receptor member D-like n=1 Tax=Elephantulus edwardii TaxID=28737 RepID=UPI0003F07F98|nr:PREDICTED: mas-related G-protein coupled receptor member D-like [Elephantulus edwardii]
MNWTLHNCETPVRTPNGTRTDAWDIAYLVLKVLTIFTCGCGMLGNAVVVWLLAFHVRRNPFAVYILNLAVADFLLLLCLDIIQFQEDISQTTQSHTFLVVVRTILYLAYTMDLGLLMTISVQRCLSVLFPIWYKVHRPQHLSTVVCSLLWGLALVIVTLDILFCDIYIQHCSSSDTFLGIVLLGILTPVMILSSVVLFVYTQRRPPQWRRRSSRLCVIILISVLVFVVCSLPLGIFWTITHRLQISSYVCVLFCHFTQFTSSIGSSANPFVYFLVGRWKNSRFPESLRALLSRILQEDPEVGSKGASSTNTNEVGSESQPSVVSAQVIPALD